MTPDQFKAWFEGFCEGISDAPTPEQWAKIKAKIGELRAIAPSTNVPPDWRRQWGQISQNGNIAYGAPVSHETRVVDPVSGRDLGCSD